MPTLPAGSPTGDGASGAPDAPLGGADALHGGLRWPHCAAYGSRWTRVGGYDVHYLEAGADAAADAPPLVFVHGFGGWAEVSWGRALTHFAPHRRALAPDMVGFGLSSRPGDGFFSDADDPLGPAAGFLEAFLDTAGVDRATLVGNSWGGGVALALALARPERVERLVLVDSFGLGKSVHYAFKLLALPVLGAKLAEPHRARLRRFWEALVHPDVEVPEAVVERSYELLSIPGSKEVLLAARHGVGLTGQKTVLTDRLAEVEAPTLVVWGADDPVFPLRQGERAAELLPRGRLEVIPECGHVPPFERPAAFNGALEAFLDGDAHNP